jgi:hypothetical protein
METKRVKKVKEKRKKRNEVCPGHTGSSRNQKRSVLGPVRPEMQPVPRTEQAKPVQQVGGICRLIFHRVQI